MPSTSTPRTLVNGSRGLRQIRRALLELEIGLAEHFLEPGRGSVPASEFFTLRWRAGGISHRVHIDPRRPRPVPRGSNIAQLNLTLEGSMGKRTKFQVDSKPQLRVAEATTWKDLDKSGRASKSPELNEDSVLLEDVAFDDQRRANVQDPRRAALTSCVALALCLDVKKHKSR